MSLKVVEKTPLGSRKAIPFTIPISSTGGTIACTIPEEQVYVLTFTSAPDNRVTIPFIKALMLSLDIIEHRFPPGVVVTTSGIGKFYSNGYPMPTIALINGHAFGAGCFLGLAHDYRIQNSTRGFNCLPEIDMGVLIPTAVQAMFKQKIPNPIVFRDVALEGRRFGGPEALKMGWVDGLGGMEEVLKLVKERKLASRGVTSAWGGIKEDMYSETLAAMDDEGANGRWRNEIERVKLGKTKESKAKVEKWEKGAKL
ncbi:enoyl-CoA hydratase/isomerase family protein [Venturia nashicola]|uniref:Enoyl-CoA hydratase/isomerase family protein n=1 Tax=Venturia nashicola TaxID=86259 RepID=A0A4Z1PKW9_9PEZI|nr:enoyl-CoA hydratase/isomerase family protein [Venturia nashicola]TLD35508.1 enoyl-CoA hydratase/isomerase family protein [Venturia nashicola]